MKTAAHRMARSAIAAAMAIGGLLVTSVPADAADGYVYVSVPTWLGNCPHGGSVSGVYVAVGDTWSTPHTGDWGDDLVWARVRMNVGYPYNAVTAKAYCSRPWYRGGSYWGPASQNHIRPTRYGQTFWVGPWGQRNN